MKNSTHKALAGITLGLLLCTGCAMDGQSSHEPNDPVGLTQQIPTRLFAPDQVNIIPLTRFVKSKKPAELDYIRVYVELLDEYKSQIKSPGTFRFELYNLALRSVEPMGKRIDMWDKTLTNLEQNNDYWQEFLRTYEFRLKLKHILQGYFILEVTFRTPEGRRLTTHEQIYLGTKP